MEELDEYDECEVEVGVSSQRRRGEGHPEVGHTANLHIMLKLHLLTSLLFTENQAIL